MAIGSSGRIVVEVDPDLKHRLYSALDEDGLTFKAWLLDSAQAFLLNRSGQVPLDFSGRDAGAVREAAIRDTASGRTQADASRAKGRVKG